jgi:hypothetical protein
MSIWVYEQMGNEQMGNEQMGNEQMGKWIDG